MEDLVSQSVSVHMSEFPIESSAQVHSANNLVNKAKNFAKMPGKGAADLNTSVMTVTSRYRHENQNSIYWVKPGSSEIYLLDFQQKGFVKEQLSWKRGGRGQLPSSIMTAQTLDANIYVIGGTRTA